MNSVVVPFSGFPGFSVANSGHSIGTSQYGQGVKPWPGPTAVNEQQTSALGPIYGNFTPLDIEGGIQITPDTVGPLVEPGGTYDASQVNKPVEIVPEGISNVAVNAAQDPVSRVPKRLYNPPNPGPPKGNLARADPLSVTLEPQRMGVPVYNKTVSPVTTRQSAIGTSNSSAPQGISGASVHPPNASSSDASVTSSFFPRPPPTIPLAVPPKAVALTSRSNIPSSHAWTDRYLPTPIPTSVEPLPGGTLKKLLESTARGDIPSDFSTNPLPVGTNCYSKEDSEKLFFKREKVGTLMDIFVQKIEEQEGRVNDLYQSNEERNEIIDQMFDDIFDLLESEEPSVTATVVSKPIGSAITTGEAVTEKAETPKGPSVWAKTRRYVFGYEHAFDDVVTRKYFDSKGFLLPTTTVDDKVAIRMAAALAKFARTRKNEHLVPNIKGFTQELSDRILNSLYPSADEGSSWPFEDPEQKALVQKSFDVVTALASKVIIANKEKMNSERVATSLRSFLDALQQAEKRFRKDSSEESPYRVSTRRSFPSTLFSGGGSKTRFRMKKNVHFKKSRKI
jgi:hypothetical protein